VNAPTTALAGSRRAGANGRPNIKPVTVLGEFAPRGTGLAAELSSTEDDSEGGVRGPFEPFAITRRFNTWEGDRAAWKNG
jgi:hypothetical protein